MGCASWWNPLKKLFKVVPQEPLTRGLDLFNNGRYGEALEVFEGLLDAEAASRAQAAAANERIPLVRYLVDEIKIDSHKLVELASQEFGSPRFDIEAFDPELLVRASWAGIPIRYTPVEVRYPEDGASHFHYLRDNAIITWMHTRLVVGMLIRLPMLLWRKARGRSS